MKTTKLISAFLLMILIGCKNENKLPTSETTKLDTTQIEPTHETKQETNKEVRDTMATMGEIVFSIVNISNQSISYNWQLNSGGVTSNGTMPAGSNLIKVIATNDVIHFSSAGFETVSLSFDNTFDHASAIRIYLKAQATTCGANNRQKIFGTFTRRGYTAVVSNNNVSDDAVVLSDVSNSIYSRCFVRSSSENLSLRFSETNLHFNLIVINPTDSDTKIDVTMDDMGITPHRK
jgi:hypothetical protein